MPATFVPNVSGAVPEIVGATAYDTILGFQGAWTTVAQDYTDLEGAGGQVLRIPVLGPVTPAVALAETVAATDDALDITDVPVTVKELVKSIGWSDQAQAATIFDLSAIAGQRSGLAHAFAMEIDLKNAAVAGRNTAADVTIGANPLRSYIVAAKNKIPILMRQRGVTALISQAMYDEVVQDVILQNSADFGDRAPIVDGEIRGPLDGMSWRVVDDQAIAQIGGKEAAIVVANQCLVRAFSKRPQLENERDALGRLSRIVSTQIFASGVVDDRGITAAIRP